MFSKRILTLSTVATLMAGTALAETTAGVGKLTPPFFAPIHQISRNEMRRRTLD